MIAKSTIFTAAFLTSLGIVVSSLPTTKTVVAQSSGSSSPYKLPYPGGKTYQVTKGNCGDPILGHCDAKSTISKYAWDFANTGQEKEFEVVATRAGTVRSLYADSDKRDLACNGRSLPPNWYEFTNYVVIDHGDGTSSLYAHLKYKSVPLKVGDKVLQGQKLGISSNTGYACGIHLHYAVQQTPSGSNYGNKSGGYWTQSKPSSFSDPDVLRQNSNGIPTTGKSYTSSNGTFNNSDTFKQPISSSISVTQQSVNLRVCASNLSGRTVYVQMWRDAANGFPPKEWNVSKAATSTCMDFSDLEGPGDTFSGVTYYTVASLTPTPAGEAAKKRTSCWSTTGGKYLCDGRRR